MTQRLTVVSACLGLVLAAGASSVAQAAPAARSLSETSYARARQVLDAAIEAAGGEQALQSVKDVWRKGRGTAFNQGQSPKVEPPYATRPVEVTSVTDFANRRSVLESATLPQGGTPSKARAVLAGDAGFAANLVTNVMTPSTPAGLNAARTALRRDPAVLLLTAAGRAETLRSLGEEAFEGRPHRVLTFADSDGTQIALYFDAATSLLSKYETLADNAVLGDTLSEVVFSDYRSVGPVKLPFRVVNRTAGEVVLDLAYSDIRINTSPAASLFEAPKDAVAGTPTGPASSVTMKKLAEDVYLVEGSSHNSLLVAFQDHVVLVDAPLGAERSQAVLAKIQETLPSKRVKYVVATHHHYDHSGGLRPYIANGAVIVTTPGNKAFVERMAATPHTIRPDALSRAPRPALVETFEKRRVLTDGVHTLELHDVGPNPHVSEAVVAYLPKEKIVFQSDLVALPAFGPLPAASPATVDLLARLQKLGLAVETIVGAHGRIGTMEEVTRTLAAK